PRCPTPATGEHTRQRRRRLSIGPRHRMAGPDFLPARCRQISAMSAQTSGRCCVAGQLTIWGRANSVNVQKVLWCLAELDIPYTRIDAGMAFGKNYTAEYLAMNPNGRVPTLVDGDYVLWESNSIMRYLNLAYGKASSIYPQDAKGRAAVDRWLDWTLSTLQPVDRPVFWGLVRTPPDKRDMAQLQKDADAEAAVWRVVETQLQNRRFIEGDQFTLADIALG